MKITLDPNHIPKISQQNRILWVWKPYTQNFRAINCKMKKNIHFNQHPVLSYALLSCYLWFPNLLLPWQQYSPNITFWIGLEESFQKMYTFTPPSNLSFLRCSFPNENLLWNDWFCDFSLCPPPPPEKRSIGHHTLFNGFIIADCTIGALSNSSLTKNPICLMVTVMLSCFFFPISVSSYIAFLATTEGWWKCVFWIGTSAMSHEEEHWLSVLKHLEFQLEPLMLPQVLATFFILMVCRQCHQNHDYTN